MTVDTENLLPDDVVSLSRAQTSVVAVLSTPAGPEAYSVTLPINVGQPAKTFTFNAQGGETVAQLLVGLEDVLLQEQTKFSVAVDPINLELVIVGRLGESFPVIVTSNLTVSIDEEAVSAVDAEGEQIPPLRVVVPEQLLGFPPRRFTTRTVPDGQVKRVHMILCQEVGGSRRFDVDAVDIKAIVRKVI